MAASQPANFNLQEFTDAGLLLFGGRLYTYAYGTTTQKTAYTDPAGTVPHTYTSDGAGGQYIALNVRGELPAPLYLGTGSYDLALKRADGSTVWTRKADGVDNSVNTLSAALADTSGSTLVGYQSAAANALWMWANEKLDERRSARDFMTPQQRTNVFNRVGTQDVTAALQAGIDALYAVGGGVLYLPGGKYKITTLNLRSNVILAGDVGAYQPDTATGVQFVLAGSGISGVVGTNVIRVGMRNIRIDGSALTGTTNVGLDLNGFWLSHFENVTVFGISPSEGYGIKCRTGTGTPSFGSQHNHFILCETPDGMMRFEGKGASDQVTTTTVITHRGFQYEVQHCQITFINATAEGWTSGSGFYFYGSGDSVMLHCDIEGTGPVGITVGDTHVLHGSETTIWAGYSGSQRVNGQPTTAGTEYQATVTAGNVFPDFFRQSDNNTTYARGRIRADNIGGGTQEGHVEILRRYGGAEVLQFEWHNQVKVENSKSIANVATTVFSIPVPSAGGVRVKTSARGTQNGAGPFVTTLETVCVNNFGTLAKTDGTALSVQTGGSSGAITYTISGTNLLVQCAHGSATPSTISFVIEIDGDGSGYSKV